MAFLEQNKRGISLFLSTVLYVTMNHLDSSRSDESCSILDYPWDERTSTPHCMMQRGDDASSPPHLLPKKIVSPLTTSRQPVSLLAVENKQQLLTFSRRTNGAGTRRDTMSAPSSSSSDDGVDMEIVELHDNNHHYGGIPMFPVEALDDIMDDTGRLPSSHKEPAGDSSATTIIYLQPRVPIHGCKIPPVDPSRTRRHHDLELESDRNDHDMLLARGRGVPTFQDLGLLPMTFSPGAVEDDHEKFWNNASDRNTASTPPR